MKTIKVSLTALAVILAVGASVIGTQASSTSLANYDYQKVGAPDQLLNVARETAQSEFECLGANILCAEAYLPGQIGVPAARVPAADIFETE